MAQVPMTEGTDEEMAMTRSVLLHTIDSIMKMLHPFLPIVTEEICQTIDSSRSIVVSEWLESDENYKYPESKEGMAFLVDIIKSVRQTRSAVTSPLSRPIDIQI